MKIILINLLLMSGYCFGNGSRSRGMVRRKNAEVLGRSAASRKGGKKGGKSKSGAAEATGDFLLCRQVPDRPNFGLEESVPEYLDGEPIFSELTEIQANAIVTDIATSTQAVIDTGTAVLGLLEAAKALSGTLTVASGALSVFTHFFGKSETDVTQALIRSEFARTNQMIAELSSMVTRGFDNIRRDVADNSLDEVMAPLQAIDFAYREMIAAFDETNSTELKRTYTARYRAACNVPHLGPEDIFRELYGFACGSAGLSRDCGSTGGVGTGACQFGTKKRQYVLDIYDDLASGDIFRFRSFSVWLLNAMLLAQFLSGACLPQEATSCTDGAVDPVRQKIAQDQQAAFVEVANNLQRTEECFEEEFRANINAEFLTNIADNGACLSGEGNDPEKNGCVANATWNFITQRFTDLDFLVVVYNFESLDDREEFIGGSRVLVDRDGEEGDDFGFIAADNVETLGNRFFHFMYRGKEENGVARTKTNFNNDAGENVLDFVQNRQNSGCLGDCDCAIVSRFWAVPGEQEGLTICCLRDPSNNREAAAREHGFLAFQTNNGIPRAAWPPTTQRFQIFWEGNADLGLINIDSCDQNVELIV